MNSGLGGDELAGEHEERRRPQPDEDAEPLAVGGVAGTVGLRPDRGVVRADRAERNSPKTVTGEFGEVDRRTWQALKPVLAAA